MQTYALTQTHTCCTHVTPNLSTPHLVVAGWTQAINTLGMCANPTEEQLKVEAPTMQRPTRAVQKRFAGARENQEVVKVMVFKGATGKAAVIRAVTYDLLFNNMKSIVMKTASKCCCTPCCLPLLLHCHVS